MSTQPNDTKIQPLAQKHIIDCGVGLQRPFSQLQVAYLVALSDDGPPLTGMAEASQRIATRV
jgi:hypothetical protein